MACRRVLDVNLETFGNLGEFIGSIAVLITLVYIAIQTRQPGLVSTRIREVCAGCLTGGVVG